MGEFLDIYDPTKLNQEEEVSPNSSCELNITQITKPDKDKIKKKIVDQFL
jgi:hypothetical protein